MEPVLLRNLDIEKTAFLLDLEFCQLKHFCALLMILQNEYNVLIIGKRREKHLEYLINHLLWIDLFKWGSSLSINIMSLFALHCISSNETISLGIGNLMVHLNLRWTSILHYLAVMNGHFQPASMTIGPVKIYLWFSYKKWFLFVTGCKQFY